MNTILNSQPSTFQQWKHFRSVLSDHSSQSNQLIRASSKASQTIVRTLEKQLPKPEEVLIFRRLGKHTQLCLHFS